jgi:hypothetical protein
MSVLEKHVREMMKDDWILLQFRIEKDGSIKLWWINPPLLSPVGQWPE